MSRYSDKNRHTAVCTYCLDPATKLMLIEAKPRWVCDLHYDFENQKL